MQITTTETRLNDLAQDVREIKDIVSQMDNRVDSLEYGQRDLSNRLTSMDNRQNSNFKWLVGLLITVLITNIGTAITTILTLK